jgi:uncharacterized protein YggE
MAEPQTVNVRPPVAAILAAVVIGGAFYLAGKHVETRDREIPVITVSGEGKTSVAPDIAELSFGMQTGRQKTAGDAMTVLKKAMDGVLASVKKSGIADKDINTEQFSLNPTYDWTSGRQTIIGYEAVQSLRVKVRNLDKVSDVLGAATVAGANQAGGVQFTVDDPEKSRSEARTKAIAQAKQKAEALAKDLGLHLGKIKSFSENGGSTPPMYMRGMAAGATMEDKVANQTVELPAGEQDVNVQVSITYELR